MTMGQTPSVQATKNMSIRKILFLTRSSTNLNALPSVVRNPTLGNTEAVVAGGGAICCCWGFESSALAEPPDQERNVRLSMGDSSNNPLPANTLAGSGSLS